MQKQKTWGLFGSGFGVYGYLPALAKLGDTVLMPSRYRQKIARRLDVACFIPSIEFYEKDQDILDECSHLVFARRPTDQQNFLANNVSLFKSKILFLEKPLASSNNLSLQCFSTLVQNDIKFRLGFFSRYTAWFSDLSRIFKEHENQPLELSLSWHLCASHFSSERMPWKGLGTAGGGAFYFYCSHLIHALSMIGAWSPTVFLKKNVTDDVERSLFIQMRHKNNLAKIVLDTFNTERTCFEVCLRTKERKIYSYSAASIFEMPHTYDVIDPRSNLVFQHIQQEFDQKDLNAEYKKYLTLEKKCLEYQVEEFVE